MLSPQPSHHMPPIRAAYDWLRSNGRRFADSTWRRFVGARFAHRRTTHGAS